MNTTLRRLVVGAIGCCLVLAVVGLKHPRLVVGDKKTPAPIVGEPATPGGLAHGTASGIKEIRKSQDEAEKLKAGDPKRASEQAIGERIDEVETKTRLARKAKSR